MMETAIQVYSQAGTVVLTPKVKSLSVYSTWLAFEDTQADNKTAWYLVSMIAQGVFFLPIPAYLIYYYHAPVVILFITMALFFSNIIAGMGGYGIRVLMPIFAISILVHILMILLYVL